MSKQKVSYSVKNGVGTILLDDAETFNAIDTQVSKDYLDVAVALETDKDVRAVIIKSAVKGFFSVGGNIKGFIDAGENIDDYMNEITINYHAALSRLMRMDAPVIVQIAGTAAGAGASLVCVADMVIASESAKLTFAYTRSAITPDGGGTFCLPRIVGVRKAYELMVLNPTLSADEALALGIFNKVVNNDQLENTTLALAEKLAIGPTKAYGGVKKLLLSTYEKSAESQMEAEALSIASRATQADAQEGIKAFLEKRKPVYIGK